MTGFVSIARIVKKRGIRGEVTAELLTDFPERFASLNKVHIDNAGRRYREELERYWFHKHRIVLKFRGRDRPEKVQELVGGELQVPEEDRYEIPEDSYYYSDLIGCEVVENEKLLGMVSEIFETDGIGSHLVVKTEIGGEFMIPLVREFFREVDVKDEIIKVSLPEGLVVDT